MSRSVQADQVVDHSDEAAWVLFLGDMSVFALFVATYVYYRQDALAEFAQAQNHLHREIGTLNTLILLVSSLTMVLAQDALKRGLLRWAQSLFGATVLLGAAFVAIKSYEYSLILAQLPSPLQIEFFSYYFMLTGLHMLHVVIGLGLLLGVCVRLVCVRGKPAPTGFIEVCGRYWHMVDLIWLMIFPMLYLL